MILEYFNLGLTINPATNMLYATQMSGSGPEYSTKYNAQIFNSFYGYLIFIW